MTEQERTPTFEEAVERGEVFLDMHDLPTVIQQWMQEGLSPERVRQLLEKNLENEKTLGGPAQKAEPIE